MDTKIDSTRAIPAPIIGRFSGVSSFVKGKLKVFAILALLVIGSGLAYFWWTKKESATDYVTAGSLGCFLASALLLSFRALSNGPL
jgi:hypothetical protein